MKKSFTALALVMSVSTAFAQSSEWDSVSTPAGDAAGTIAPNGTTFGVIFIPGADCQATFSIAAPVSSNPDAVKMTVATTNPADPAWVCRTKEIAGDGVTTVYCDGFLSERAFKDIMGSKRVGVRVDYLERPPSYDEFTLDGSRKAIGDAALKCFERALKDTTNSSPEVKI